MKEGRALRERFPRLSTWSVETDTKNYRLLKKKTGPLR